MCGHAVIAIMTLAMQMHWVDIIDNTSSMTIEAPCGLIRARGVSEDGKITASFECVPSFVAQLNQTVTIDSLNQTINYDLAYGGAFYAYVDAKQLDLKLTPDNNQQLIALGREIKHAVIASNNHIEHPFEPELSNLYGTIFIGESLLAETGIKADSRNVCVFADGEVDRSPTGSGVSGRVAIHYAKNEIGIAEPMQIESIIGSQFSAQVVRTEQYAQYTAVIPQVSGDAFICGFNEFVIQPDDRLKRGFLSR